MLYIDGGNLLNWHEERSEAETDVLEVDRDHRLTSPVQCRAGLARLAVPANTKRFESRLTEPDRRLLAAVQ